MHTKLQKNRLISISHSIMTINIFLTKKLLHDRHIYIIVFALEVNHYIIIKTKQWKKCTYQIFDPNMNERGLTCLISRSFEFANLFRSFKQRLTRKISYKRV